ncbi:sugar kinase [Maribellus comscasis]|uniref:Sugar kinase n=1 Tax=Maribellus comscasis TaxID=2681766 RepID=A0A6I6K486_9BACT|nr:PfkB family carbohydrate kinase [Maribellus comscasis]QGY47262.1 sugar kinase [Maribellus comscasis]
MKKSRGLFIGLTTIDIQYFVEEFPVSNVKLKSQPPDILVGGPATNAAVVFAKLNGNASLISAVGKNPFCDFVKNDFHQVNVNLTDLMEGEEFSPILALVVSSLKNGDRNIFTHHPKAICPKIAAEYLIESELPDIVMFDGFYPEVGIECAKIAKARNIPIVLDCGSWKPQYEELLNFADIAICSNNFYPQFTNNNQQVLSYLKEKNVKYFAISRGEKPILLYNNNTYEKIPVEGNQVIDTLGAGDFLHGAFCYYFVQYNNFEKALKKASEIATLSCRYKGTREWLNFLD